MAGNIKGITIEIDGNTTGLDKALQNVNKQSRSLESELRQINKLLKVDSSNIATLGQKYQVVAREVDTLSQKLNTLRDAQAQVDQQFANGEISEEQYRAFQREITATEQKLTKYQAELEKTSASLKELEATTKTNAQRAIELGEKWQQSGEKIAATGDKINKAGNALTVGVTAPIAAMGVASAKAAMEFESAFAGVIKTVDATARETEALKQGIRDMALEIPAAVEDIADVAAAAGQLAIAVPNIESFTRVMTNLGVATDLAATDAATSLAQFANITQMAQTDFDRLGSTIVALGNNTATMESSIVAMGQRLAGAGAQAKMSEADIMAIAAALSSVGVEAQAGGSAFSKLITQMQVSVETGSDKLQQFAQVAGMSADQFAQAFQADAAGALNAFISGLGNMEAQGKSATIVLDEMGITEIRLSDAIKRLAGAGDLLGDTLALGNQAWAENIALTKEAETRYGTTESKVQLAKNALNDAAITIGNELLPVIADVAQGAADLAKSFGALEPSTQKGIIGMVGFAAAIGPVTKGIGLITKGYGTVTKLSGSFVASMGASAAGAAATGTAATGAAAGVTTLGTSIMTFLGPVGLAIIALGGISAGLLIAYGNSQKTETEFDRLAQTTAALSEEVAALTEAQSANNEAHAKTVSDIENEATAANNLISKLDELAKVENKSNAEKAGMRTLVEQLNAMVPGLALSYDEEADALNKTTSEMRDYIAASKDAAMATAWRDKAVDAARNQATAEEKLYKVQQQRKAIEDKIAETQKAYTKAANEAAEANAFYDGTSQDLQLTLIELNAQLDELALTENEAAAAAQSAAEGFAFASERQLESSANVAEANAVVEESSTAAADSVESLAASLGMSGEEYEAYAEKQKAAYETMVGNTQNAFDKIKSTVKLTVDDMISNLEHNQQMVADWSNNLGVLADRGLDQGLLQKLREAGPEAADTVQNLVNASDEKLQTLSDTFANGTQAATDAMLAQLGLPEVVNAGSNMVDQNALGMQENTSMIDATVEMVTNLSVAMDEAIAAEDFYGKGYNIGEGVAEGIIASIPLVAAAASQMAVIAGGSFNKKMDINSPSGVGRESGLNYGQGVALGIKDAMGIVSKQSQRMASELQLVGAKVNAAAASRSTVYNSNVNAHFNLYSSNKAELDRVVNYVNQQLGRKIG